MNPTNIYYTSTPTSSKITLIFPSPLGAVTQPTILKADGTTMNISNMIVTGNIVEIDILQVLSFEDSISILSDKNFSSSTKAQYFIGGKGPNQIDANSLLNVDFKENIFIFANEDSYFPTQKKPFYLDSGRNFTQKILNNTEFTRILFKKF